jgi:hypothetical protein
MPFESNKKTVATITAIALLGALPSLFKIDTFDTFFHLAAGRQIIDTLTVPTVDTFSYTFRGQVWQNHSPLFQAVIALIERGFGFEGLSIFQYALTAVLIASAIAASIRFGAPLFCASVFSVAPFLVFSGIIVPRPHVFGFLFLSICLTLILSAERKARMRPLFWLSPVFVLWLLSHGSAVLLLAIILICLAAALITKRKSFIVAYGITFAASFVAIIALEPSALSLASSHVDSSFLSAEIPEWQGFSFRLLFGTTTGLCFMSLWLITLAGWLVKSGLIKLGKKTVDPRDRTSPQLSIVLLGLMAMSLTSNRMAPLFLIGAAPLWIPQAAWITLRISQALPSSMRRILRPVAAVLFITAVFITCFFDETHAFGVGLRRDRLPEAAVAALDRTGRARRIYNAYNYGGYLMIARHAPSDGVFVDGRAVTLYSSEFLSAFAAAYTDPAIFERLAKTYRCDSVLLPVKSRRTPLLLRYLDRSNRWINIFRDNESAAYLLVYRRTSDI